MPDVNEEVPASKKARAATASDRSTSNVDKHSSTTLDGRTDQGGNKSVSLTTVKGRGIRPGINLDCSASLLDQLEKPEWIP